MTEEQSGPEAGYVVSDVVDEVEWIFKDSYDFENRSKEIIR